MSPIVLTPRDERLLETLYDFGLMTTAQLGRRIFPGVKATTVLRRLRKLSKRGFIASQEGLGRGKFVWSVTAKGGSLIGFPQGYGHVNRNSLEHDVAVSEVRLTLEEIGAVTDWQSGHLLKRAVAKPKRGEKPGPFPDGILLVAKKDHPLPVAIEVELTAKAAGRYLSVLSSYEQKKSIAAVWYLTSQRSIGKAVLQASRSPKFSPRKTDWVFWTPLSELLEKPHELQFRGKSGCFPLSQIVPNLKAPAHCAAQSQSKEAWSNSNQTPANSLKLQRTPPTQEGALGPQAL